MSHGETSDKGKKIALQAIEEIINCQALGKTIGDEVSEIKTLKNVDVVGQH